MNHYGITHLIPMWALPVWKKLFCHYNWHLFDEVLRADDKRPHELYCDACGLSIGITYKVEEQ